MGSRMPTRSVCLKIIGVEQMSGSLLNRILDEAGSFSRRTGCTVFPRYFNEATGRDDFVDIMEKQFSLGLTFDSFWFPTNGEGLVKLPDGEWKRLADTGFSWLRLAFHGAGAEHDEFLGKPGAWDTLAKTARKAEEYGIDWFPVIFINRVNAHRYSDIRSAVERMGSPSLAAGWMVPNWQNNPEYDANRVSISQISHLTEERSLWRSEGAIIDMIEQDAVLASSPVFDSNTGISYLGCLPDGRVCYAGGCHGEPFTACRDSMVIGSWNDGDTIDDLLRAGEDPPEQVKALEKVTFGDLAGSFGVPGGELVYRIQDLVVNKWGSMYLASL